MSKIDADKITEQDQKRKTAKLMVSQPSDKVVVISLNRFLLSDDDIVSYRIEYTDGHISLRKIDPRYGNRILMELKGIDSIEIF